jgi:hypothetical protein
MSYNTQEIQGLVELFKKEVAALKKNSVMLVELCGKYQAFCEKQQVLIEKALTLPTIKKN